ncbi:MAG: hypothetical protein HYX78_06725 [Armatimonadetes bacterium]|nr:hypothetical protein [Armatimonadota bacterium]
MLETVFHAGFFEDGEYIPKCASMIAPPLDISERPAFRIRQYLSICADDYTGGYWLFDGWKYECDYAAKKRQNFLNIDMPWVIYGYLKRSVEKKYGVSDSRMSLVGPPSPADRFDIDLYRKVTNYARVRLGSAILGPVGIANISPGFRNAHPEIPYVQTTDLNDTTSVYLDPASPVFKDYVKYYFRLHNKLFGTDHYYYVPAMGLETLESAFGEHRPNLRVEYGKAALEAVKNIDPAAVMFTDGWGYMQWPPEVVDDYCSAFPKDDFLTHDMWAELPSHSKHKTCDYYSGRNWLLGVLHSFAGDECMFGDMQRVISTCIRKY